jgi:hypothetical protein
VTRRASHALLSVVLFLGVCLATMGDAFGPRIAHADTAPPAWPVAVGITEVTPLIPTDLAQAFSIKGAVKNTGAKPLTISIRLQISRMTSRGEMHTKTPTGSDGHWLGKAQPINGASLTPQNASPWSITVPTIKELLQPYGQHPGVYAVDAVAVDGGNSVIGVQRTFLAWKPLTDSAPVGVALVWPMAATPALTGIANNSGQQIVADTGDLASQLQTDGRLDRIVSLGSQLGQVANWVVDPDLLYTASQMRNGSAPYANPNSGLGSGEAARAWLTAAQAALKGANCWLLPYADPDLATLSHTPQGLSLLKAAAGLAPSQNIQSCDRRDQVLAWPGSGDSDIPTTAAIHQYLPNATALVADTFYDDKAMTRTHATLDGNVNALVSDTYLNDVFAPVPVPDDGLSTPGLLAGQSWLAQTALMAREATANRSAIAAPPRNFDPTPALLKAMQSETKLPQAEQWMTFTKLADLKNAPATDLKSPAKQVDPVPKSNLDQASVVNVAVSTQSVYSAFLAILESKESDDRAVPFRMVATSWRGQPAPAKEYAAAVNSRVNLLHNSVSLAPVGPLTLSGKTGQIPVTIKNDLSVAVVVNLQASSDGRNWLDVTSQPGQTIVPRGGTSTVRIPVRAVGSGHKVTITAVLHQPGPAADKPGDLYYPAGTGCKSDGSCLGQVHALVKVSAIGIIALALMIGSAAVLVVAIGLRVLRANRAHHAAGHDTMAS